MTRFVFAALFGILLAPQAPAADCGCHGSCGATGCVCVVAPPPSPGGGDNGPVPYLPAPAVYEERQVRVGLFRTRTVLVKVNGVPVAPMPAVPYPQPMAGPPVVGAVNNCPGGVCPNPRALLPRR